MQIEALRVDNQSCVPQIGFVGSVRLVSCKPTLPRWAVPVSDSSVPPKTDVLKIFNPIRSFPKC